MTQVFILSRNRPLYLWACLDSLYRLTRSPARFTLIDSASTDPLVKDVVAGFSHRRLLDEVIWLERNDSQAARQLIAARCTPEDEFIAFIESDVVIQPGPFEYWLARMRGLIEAMPALAILGSLVEPDDFVSIEQARRTHPDWGDDALSDIIRRQDPERAGHQADYPGQTIVSPHNPAGRLLLIRTKAVARAGGASDHDLHARLRELGYSTGISTEVRHRHLSLLNLFDYPDYNMRSRDQYMYTHTYKAQAEALLERDPGGVTMTQDPDLHLLVDDQRLDAARDGESYRFSVPPGARSGSRRLVLVSRRGYAMGSADRRPLGVAIDRLLLDGTDALPDGALDRGWYGAEDGWRWTSGHASLPNCSSVEVHVASTLDYILDGS